MRVYYSQSSHGATQTRDMELPSMVFQFTWAAACVKYWHMLEEDGALSLRFANLSDSMQRKQSNDIIR